MDFLLEPLQYGFIQRALWVSLIIGVTCPMVGIFVVTRGYSFMGDAVAHAVFPGLVAALVAKVSPWVGMLPAALGTSALVTFLTRRTGVLADTSIAIVFATLFSLGVILLSVYRGTLAVEIEDILLGQILGVSASDIYWSLLAALLTGILLLAFFHKLIFVSFDPIGAEVSGISAGKMDYLLLGLIAIVVIIAIQAVGVILSVAMIVTPAAAAILSSRRLQWIMPLAVLIGIVSAVLGLYISYYLNLPTGPCMALTATAIFGLVAVSARRDTLVKRLA